MRVNVVHRVLSSGSSKTSNVFVFSDYICAACVPRPSSLLLRWSRALSRTSCSRKAVVENGENGGNIFGGAQSIGKGLNNGILYLMAVPYMLLFLLFRKKIVGFFKEFAGAQG